MADEKPFDKQLHQHYEEIQKYVEGKSGQHNFFDNGIGYCFMMFRADKQCQIELLTNAHPEDLRKLIGAVADELATRQSESTH